MVNRKESGTHQTKWKIEKFKNDEAVKNNTPYETKTIKGNILVNAGINEMWNALTGDGGTAYDNANAYLGVGDSDDAATASQTDLQAAVNKNREGMNDGYPTYGTDQKITFQSDFDGDTANYAWNEFAAFNASTAGTMLNRKVEDEGEKTAGQTWRLSLEITLS
jgi:hypothetical protein